MILLNNEIAHSVAVCGHVVRPAAHQPIGAQQAGPRCGAPPAAARNDEGHARQPRARHAEDIRVDILGMEHIDPFLPEEARQAHGGTHRTG